MHPISGVGFCGPRSPTTSGLAPVLGAAPGSGAPGRRISRRLLDRRSRVEYGGAAWRVIRPRLARIPSTSGPAMLPLAGRARPAPLTRHVDDDQVALDGDP